MESFSDSSTTEFFFSEIATISGVFFLSWITGVGKLLSIFKGSWPVCSGLVYWDNDGCLSEIGNTDIGFSETAFSEAGFSEIGTDYYAITGSATDSLDFDSSYLS